MRFTFFFASLAAAAPLASAVPAEVRAAGCKSGTYACDNGEGGRPGISVCQNGQYRLQSYCNKGQSCSATNGVPHCIG